MGEEMLSYSHGDRQDNRMTAAQNQMILFSLAPHARGPARALKCQLWQLSLVIR
jgi:hypothetical protein